MLRRFLWATCVLAAALLLGTAPPAWSGTTGKLSGRVVNEKKEPLAGVNVRIVGQRLGAITDDHGEYFIIGVPAGTYTVRMNMVGYTPYVASKVVLSPDFTTGLDAALRTEAVQMGEVHVDATRPLLQKDATGTTRFLSSEDIQRLPTRGYRDAAAQQTGVVNFQRQIDNESQNGNTLIVRGGRPNETAYFVDGFSQQDPLTGTSSTAISNNSIQEVVVMTGGFNAEYGRIMSGAVNVVTKEGASTYGGSIEAVTDNLAGNWVGAGRTDYNAYDVSFGGPLTPKHKNLTFYGSAERRWQGDRNPSAMSDLFKDQLLSEGFRDNVKPYDTSGGYTFQGKLGWQLSEKMTLKAGGLGSEDDWRQYIHAYLLNDAPHMPRTLDRNVSYYTTFNHVLSSRTFYNLSWNWFDTQRKQGDGVAFDQLAEYYLPTNPTYDTDAPLFWDAGHVYNDYIQRNSSYYGLQASVTSQVNHANQVKAGADFQRHSLRYLQHYYPIKDPSGTSFYQNWDGYGYTLVPRYDAAGNVSAVDVVESDAGRDGAKHPITWSAYVQDKYEREGVVVNAGLRFDYLNVDTPALVNEHAPLALGAHPDSLDPQDLGPNRTYARVSPRLGVSFPVDQYTQLRFNYGQFYQQPNLQDLYSSYRFMEYKLLTGGYFVGFGNPNLKPERTTAYEFGFARLLDERTRLDVTAYYKDVRDLVEVTTIAADPGANSKSFTSYRNRDYATIKGVDVGLTMREVNHLSGSLSYSLAFAQGTGSVSNTQRNIAWVGSNPPKQTAPLDFDQRHKLSINANLHYGKGEGVQWGQWRPLQDFGVDLLYDVASGTPYTPTLVYNELSLAAVSPTPAGPINSRNGPWTQDLDLKVTRDFKLGDLSVQGFLWVLNVFDVRNPVNVFTSTGTAETTGWLNTNDGQGYLATAAGNGKDGDGLYRLAESDPTLYSNPRLVRFGLRLDF